MYPFTWIRWISCEECHLILLSTCIFHMDYWCTYPRVYLVDISNMIMVEVTITCNACQSIYFSNNFFILMSQLCINGRWPPSRIFFGTKRCVIPLFKVYIFKVCTQQTHHVESTCNWGGKLVNTCSTSNPGVFHVDFFMMIIGVDSHVDIKLSLSLFFHV